MIGNPQLIQIYLDKGQKRAFKRWCFQNDITMSQQLRRLIREHLREEGVIPPYSLGDSQGEQLPIPLSRGDKE